MTKFLDFGIISELTLNSTGNCFLKRYTFHAYTSSTYIINCLFEVLL